MNETDASGTRGYVLGPAARVVVHRSRQGYSVAVVHSEGPFSLDQAQAIAAKVRQAGSGQLTPDEAAEILGISRKGVTYLRQVGHLTTTSPPNARVLIDADSVYEYQRKRNGE